MQASLKISAALVLLLLAACAADKRFAVTDLTPENSFTQNCEGPNVDKDGNLYVVNFQKDGTIGVVRPNGKAELLVELPTGSTANSIRFNSKGNMFLADYTGHNILLLEMPSQKISVFCHNDQFNQPNDLCVSRDDVVYASDPNWSKGTGQVWKITPDGKASLLQGDMGTTNGIELSPDEQTLYVNESVQNNIWAFDLSPSGVSHKKLFAHFNDFGLDGMKCDQRGNLYVARYGKGVIAVLSPNGKILREISTKGKKTSNLAFGGKDGKTIYVTLQDRKCVEQFHNDVAGK